jgi:protein TonB
MNKFFLILTILICNVFFSQEKIPPLTQPGVIVDKEIESSPVYEKVDEEAIFLNGGIYGFRNEFGSLFNSSIIKGRKGVTKTVITFIVEKDGTIVDIKAVGENQSLNKEAIETIKKIKTKWSPALIYGNPVRSRFKMPISVNIE